MTGLSGVYGDEAVVTCTEGWLILSGHRTQTIICGRAGRWTTLGLTTLEQCSGVILVHNIADAHISMCCHHSIQRIWLVCRLFIISMIGERWHMM